MPNLASKADSARTVEVDPRLRVLSVSPTSDDHITLGRLLAGTAWEIDTAEDCDAALRRIREGRIGIVICEQDLPDGTWRNLLNYVQTRPEKPFLIVTSILADEQLWAEVLNLGGYDVIAKPFDSRDATHVLETAYLQRIGVMPARQAAAAA